MNTPDPIPHNEVSRRLAHVGVALVVTIAGIGFLAGVRAPLDVTLNPPAVAAAPANEILTAPTYRDLGSHGPLPRAEAKTTVAQFAQSTLPPRVGEEVVPALAARPEALVARKSHRAFDGAPPTIPHRVNARGLPCLACHGDGMVIGERVASPISHPEYASCTQCHAGEKNPFSERTLQLADAVWINDFVGLESAANGDRAWAGAPPLMPHTDFMRENCMSCHGPLGEQALKSSHPERQSCAQCHGGSAGLEQRPVSMGL